MLRHVIIARPQQLYHLLLYPWRVNRDCQAKVLEHLEAMHLQRLDNRWRHLFFVAANDWLTVGNCQGQSATFHDGK